MRKNGLKNNKQRWRCSCGYNETDNSTAHNSNKRTGYGYTNKYRLINH